MLRTLLVASSTALTIAITAASCSSSSTTNEVVGPSAARCAMRLGGTPTVPATGGSVTATVIADRDCVWSAQVDSDWLSLDPGSGQGEAPLTLSSSANPRGRPRTATLVVNDQRFPITQEPAPCGFEVTPAEMDAPPQGGRLTFQVNTIEGCAWSAQTDERWLRVISGSGGEGSRSVEVTADSNAGGERSATLRIAGVNVRVSQASAEESGERCGYSLSSGAANLPAEGGDGSVRVHTRTGCLWGATSNQSWLVLVSGQNGSGTGGVRYRAEPNPTAQRRSGVIAVGTRRHVVQQAAGPR